MNKKKYIKMYINHFSFNLCAKKSLCCNTQKKKSNLYVLCNWLVHKSGPMIENLRI